MKFSLETIAAQLPFILRSARLDARNLTAEIAPGSMAGGAGGWSPLAAGDRWGEQGRTYLIRVPFEVPEAWTGDKVVLHAQLGEYADLSGPEALAYLDGRPFQGIDERHREVRLDRHVTPGTRHEIVFEAYSSLMGRPNTLVALELLLLDEEAEDLYHDLRVLGAAVLTMPESSVARTRLARVLERAYRSLDLRVPGSEAFSASVRTARDILGEAFEGPERPDGPCTVAVGHAHIDLAWLWPVAQTRRKGARTFGTVLRLMEQYPEYHFVASQPALYEMVREDAPEVYEQLTERVREGRWEPTGASWVEMDCNLTGSEALVRQFLYGKRYFRDELGVDPKILWLPDVFGYSAALPQVLKGCDVDYFMTTKISWNEYNRLPYDTFRWRGIDGTEVLTHMVTAPNVPEEILDPNMPSIYTYNGKFEPFDLTGNWEAYRQKAVNDELLYLFGWGDGGGGPTAGMQETAARLKHLDGFGRVEQSSAEAFFQRLDERVWNNPDLPRWTGELYLEYHRGTYTSQGWIKRANRLAELLYREAELWAAVAGIDDEDLAAGWKDLLFHQFHDILPGSSIPEVYRDARIAYAEIRRIGESVRDRAESAVAGQEGGGALAVFNPAPFDREDPVEVIVPPGVDVEALVDAGGEPITAQAVEGRDGERRVLLAAQAPASGVARYRSSGAARRQTEGDLSVTPRCLENRFFRIELNEAGQLVSLIDKRAGREVIAPGGLGNRLVAYEDRPLNFDAWDIQIDYQDKPYPIDDLESIRVVERGPLRGALETVRRYGTSTITQRILLHRDVPRIDFPTHIDWHEHQTLLKAAFPVTVNSGRATFDIQWGNVERPTHWNTSWDWARFETCAHKWVDLSEGDYGVSLLNDCKYGHDIKDNVIRLTLLKSGIYPDPEADQGEHVMGYALLPHPGDWRTGDTVRHAYLFNMPQRARWTGGSCEGEAAGSFVRTDRPGLVIETVKPAEDGDGIIVRCYDAHNTRGPATLTFARDIASAEETTMLEDPIGPAAIAGNTLSFAVRPYGIHTFRVRLQELGT